METLVPFPNTKVKNVAANGSAAPLLCESRSSPGSTSPVSERTLGSSILQGFQISPHQALSETSLAFLSMRRELAQRQSRLGRF